MLWAVIRERSAILDQKRGKGRFSFPHNPLYATSARQRRQEERYAARWAFSLCRRVCGHRETALPFCLAPRSSWKAQVPMLKLLMLEPGEVWFPKLDQQINPLKINVMTILLEKKLLGKFNNSPKAHLELVVTLWHKCDNFSPYQPPSWLLLPSYRRLLVSYHSC